MSTNSTYPVVQRLSDLKAAQPADATLRNLLDVLQVKLELGARLPLLVLEAEQDGDLAGAQVFRSLASEERDQIGALLDGLRHHLDSMHKDVLGTLTPGTTTPPRR